MARPMVNVPKERSTRDLEIKSPRDMMFSRHPELFSESLVTSSAILEKRMLEYHLDTLTNRKEEQPFEEFCRRLAEREICPNLRPQTGPTGGGDSGTDTSTYPVSRQLALRCYWGSSKPPSGEEWGFAFSSKKKWRDKIKDDARKIAGLERKFDKVFFISNQMIPDKKRAGLEDELRRKYGFQVCILDRNWIVDKVCNDHHEDLAIDVLGLKVTRTEIDKPSGRNVERQQSLEAILNNLRKPEVYAGDDFALAQDYLTAAKLSRSLDRPRHEVDGLFRRARDLAEESGYKSLIVMGGYDHAWTNLFWFNDWHAVATIYAEIESCLPEIEDAQECELFAILWKLLWAGATRGHLSESEAKIDSRFEAIRSKLSCLMAESNRPNNALLAETVGYFLDLQQGFQNPEKMTHGLKGFRAVLKKSKGLVLYPAVRIMDNIKGIGEFVGYVPEYDELMEDIYRIVRERAGESEEGRLLFARGMQLASQGRPEELLRVMGRARVKLSKEETQSPLVAACLGCSDAYLEMGFLWASQMEALIAANFALKDFETLHQLPFEGFLATKRLAWLQLMLGRIGPFVTWHHFSSVLLNHLRSIQFPSKSHEEELMHQDAVLGCFFLNLGPDKVEKLAEFKDLLYSSNLFVAGLALAYALGDMDLVEREMPREFAVNKDEMSEFFSQLKAQPAAKQLPKNLLQELNNFSHYETKIMGVRYTVATRNSFGTLAFAENLLGVIEAALALARWENLAFIVDEVSVHIDEDESASNPPVINLAARGDSSGYRLIWKPDVADWLLKSGPGRIQKFFVQFLMKLLMDITIDPFEDLEQELDSWQKEETFHRALDMSPTIISLTNVIGKPSYDVR